jgi:hypothetical protein
MATAENGIALQVTQLTAIHLPLEEPAQALMEILAEDPMSGIVPVIATIRHMTTPLQAVQPSLIVRSCLADARADQPQFADLPTAVVPADVLTRPIQIAQAAFLPVRKIAPLREMKIARMAQIALTLLVPMEQVVEDQTFVTADPASNVLLIAIVHPAKSAMPEHAFPAQKTVLRLPAQAYAAQA